MKKSKIFKGIIYNDIDFMKTAKEFFYISIDERPYLVNVKRYQNQMCVRARYKDGEFFVTAFHDISLNEIKEIFLNEIDYKKLMKPNKKNPFRDNGLYFLGEFIESNDGFVRVFGKNVLFKNTKLFYKTIKNDVLNLFNERTIYYSNLMGINTPYKVRIKDVSSIYGSNSIQTHSITLSISLIHHSVEEIDSVIVHELSHDKYRNHSEKFYKHLLKYYPNYFYWDKKLRSGFK